MTGPIRRWSTEGLARAEEWTRAYAPTAVVIRQDGQPAAAWGEPAHKVNVRSVRKSLLSALYGIAIADGTIRLDQTLDELGIDDRPPSLSEAEKTATIRDLLMGRSGVYHPAAYESLRMAANRPPRGSHPPGSFWYYNNWDFNALGGIYRRLAGQDVFDGFDERVAKPIGMQDYSPSDGAFAYDPCSDFPAYTMRLSARDLARFGELYLNRGVWAGNQIVPGHWVDDSTRPLSRADFGLDFGYLWWMLRTDDCGEQPALAGTFMALGLGGQALAVVPSLRLCVAQLVDVAEGQESIGGAQEFKVLLHRIAAAATG